MSAAPPLDPFGPIANPVLYVPRTATERVLGRLEQWIGEEGRQVVLLSGPEGLGKTLLLRVLAEQLGPRCVSVYLPVTSLSSDDLCAYALSELGVRPMGDAEAELVARAREEVDEDRRLVLLCDDAESLGPAVTRLAALASQSEGALALVLAAGDGRAEEVRARLGPDVPEARLVAPMTPAETVRYVRVRLAAADCAPGTWLPFDAATLERIHREAGGVPRRVSQEAGHVLGAPELARPVRRLASVRPPPPETARTRRAAGDRPTPRPAAPASGLMERTDRAQRTDRAEQTERTEHPASAEGTEASGRLGPGPRPSAARPPDTPPAPPPSAPAPSGSDSPSSAPRSPEHPFLRRRPARRRPARLLGRGGARWAALALLVLASALLVSPPRTHAPPARDPDPGLGREARPGSGLPPVGAPPPTASRPDSPGSSVRVNVNAEPWARIEIDGQPMGVTPLADLPLRPGPHRFRAHLPDGRVVEREVEIGPDTRFVRFP